LPFSAQGFTNICSENEDDKCACSVRNIRRTPWPSPNEVTAPPPEFDNVDYFVNQDGNVVLNITWWQHASQLDDVTGYFVEIHPRDSSISYKRVISLPQFSDCYSSESEVYFNYANFGSVESILPGRTYGISLQATPLYQAAMEPRDKFTKVKIEECSCDSNDPVNVFNVNFCTQLKLKLCRHVEKVAESETKPNPRLPLDHQITIVAIVLFFSFLLLIIAIILLVPRLRKKVYENLNKLIAMSGRNARYKQWKYVLVLGEMYGNEVYRDLVLQIARLLHKHKVNDLRVDCNLWNISQDPVKWLQKSLSACDHIVLVAPTQSSNSCKNEQHDPFQITLDWLQNSMSPSKGCKLHVSLLNMGDDDCSHYNLPEFDNKFITVHQFSLMSKFQDFYKLIIGSGGQQPSAEELRILQSSYDCCIDDDCDDCEEDSEDCESSFSNSINDENHTSMVHLMYDEFKEDSFKC